MKKILNTIILSIVLLSIIVIPVKAKEIEMTKLILTITKATENYEIYMLLPKSYITYAIEQDGLDIPYEGVNTLKYNTIPSIAVDTNMIQEETYIENNIEYTQIKLANNGDEKYTFEILPDYKNMNMFFRFKAETRDYIMHLDNFTIQDNLCEIEYNYKENTLKKERKNKIQIKSNIKWWQIVLIAVVLLGMAYMYNKRDKE